MIGEILILPYLRRGLSRSSYKPHPDRSKHLQAQEYLLTPRKKRPPLGWR